MQISFDMPFVFRPGATPDSNAMALQASLEYLIYLNQIFLRDHIVPGLYQSGVVYGRTEVWDTIPALYARGYGDCKSLTCALVAQMRKTGLDCKPVFRFMKARDGATDYHILVQRPICPAYPTGFEDPSKILGMGLNENAYFPNRNQS